MLLKKEIGTAKLIFSGFFFEICPFEKGHGRKSEVLCHLPSSGVLDSTLPLCIFPSQTQGLDRTLRAAENRETHVFQPSYQLR